MVGSPHRSRRDDEGLNTEPWLATGAVQVEPTAWEISLREEVKFHNGTLMDASKVKGSLDLALLRRPGTRVLLDVDRVEVKDPSRMVIYTNSPIPVLPGLLTNQNTSIADQKMSVVAHSDYWQGTPALDRVEYVAFSQSDTRLIALRSGDVDISINLSP